MMRWLDDWMNGRRQAVRSLYREAKSDRIARSWAKQISDMAMERQARIDENFERSLAYFKEQKAIHALVERAPWNVINAGK